MTKTNNVVLPILMVGIISMMIAPITAHAGLPAEGFVGDYEVENWTEILDNSNGFVDTGDAPDLITVVGSDLEEDGECGEEDCGPGNTDFVITIPCDGTVSFEWFYTTDDGPDFDPAGYLLNGAFTEVTDGEGSDEQTGDESVEVLEGDEFGFRVHSVDNIVGRGFMTVEDFMGPICEEGPLEVEIDIKPGSDPNSINTKSKGVIPVALLGSESFDVTQVDVTSLAFADTTPVHESVHFEDVNGDGFTDLVSHYATQEAGLSEGDEEGCLSGILLDGTDIDACDSVRIVK